MSGMILKLSVDCDRLDKAKALAKTNELHHRKVCMFLKRNPLPGSKKCRRKARDRWTMARTLLDCIEQLIT